MKKTMTLALTLASLNSLAIDTQADSTRGISDLMYLPVAGTTSIGMKVSRTSSDADLTYISQSITNTKTDDTDLSAYLAYSINDNFSLALNIPYTFSSDEDTTYGPASTVNGDTEKTKSSGLQDIDIVAKYRIFDQKDRAVNFDLTIEFSPKTGDAESATKTADGNAFRGGTDLDITLDFGKKFKELQARGFFGLMFSGESETKDLSDGSISKTESFTSIQLGAEIQLRPSQDIYLDGGLAVIFPGEFTVFHSTESQEYSADPMLLISLKAGYDFSSNATVSLGYALTNSNRDITVSGTTLEQETSVSAFTLESTFNF